MYPAIKRWTPIERFSYWRYEVGYIRYKLVSLCVTVHQLLRSYEVVSSDRPQEPGVELWTPEYKASGSSTTPRRLERYERINQLIEQACGCLSLMIT